MQQVLIMVTAAFGRQGRYESGTNYDGKDKNYNITAFWPSLHTLFNFIILYHETAGLARGILRNF
jgi:hypothetical protein